MGHDQLHGRQRDLFRSSRGAAGRPPSTRDAIIPLRRFAFCMKRDAKRLSVNAAIPALLRMSGSRDRPTYELLAPSSQGVICMYPVAARGQEIAHRHAKID